MPRSEPHQPRSAYPTLAVAVVLVLAACGAGPTAALHQSTAVQWWLSTADLTVGLARQPDIAPDVGTASAEVSVDPSRRYQEIVGFGASLTDTSAHLLTQRLDAAARARLMNELFGRAGGLGLSLTRISIGASDFSLSHYTLDDLPAGEIDPQLAHFSLAPLRAELLPRLAEARALNPELRIMASPWSPPAWMKTNGSLYGGELRREFEPALGAYLARFSAAMEAEGLPVFALTLQNEPHFRPKDYPGMYLPAAARARIIGAHLGPTLVKRGSTTRILEWDHNWDEPAEPLAVLSDATARAYVAGVAWHCYGGEVGAQSVVHAAYPDQETYLTECSGGGWEPADVSSLPAKTRGLLIETTRHWARGVVFWNLALDEHSGPHLSGCSNCRGVVTIDSGDGHVTRNPEYYALGHLSRFVRPGAHRIASSNTAEGLANVAFINEDDQSIVLVLVNSGADARAVRVLSPALAFTASLPAQSVATFVWKAASRL